MVLDSVFSADLKSIFSYMTPTVLFPVSLKYLTACKYLEF
jgi:hypothetical protein